jgi:microcystin degradation protein MlrC
MADTNELGGFIQSLRRWNEEPEIVGLVRLPAWPSGRATAETFNWLRDEVVEAVKQALPIDGVLLALHGAMVAEEHPDVEGELLKAVRELVGPSVPIVATLDLHASVTRTMAAAADALVLYHTAPHVDVFETGVRGAAVLDRLLAVGNALRGVPRPTTAFVRVPCVLPAENANTEAATGMSADFKRKLIALEQRPEFLAAGIATVQPWLDIPDLGSAVVVTTVGDGPLASKLCSELAGELWARRREYLGERLSVADGVHKAVENSAGVVVLSDPADATTSGAPGDSVWILRELLKYDWPRPALVTVVAPEIVAAAQRVGIGQIWSGRIGGLRDHAFGCRIQVSGEVERLFDARFTMNGHLGRNLAIDMGRSAVLRVGSVRIVITSRSGPHFAPELFQAAGHDPFAASVVVAKSPCGFRAAYEQRAAAIHVVQAPGCAPPNFWEYPYEQITRPLWPWDEIADWQPDPVILGR